MPNLSTLSYRIKRRLMRELRGRTCGIEVVLDRARYRFAAGRGKARQRFLALAKLAPWGDQVNLESLDRATREQIIRAADRACAHVFDLLGSGPVHLGDEIDWHSDFKNGYRWDPWVHYVRMKWDAAPPGADIKVPWELSRCMHFATLGLADRLTNERKYYSEFKRQVRHWIAQNPVGRGVNWFCAMDVALRAVNWLNAAMLFAHRIEDDTDDRFLAEMEEALWMAGRHISRNLEWQGPGSSSLGNHFLADLIGLLGIGMFFADCRCGRRWVAFARRWLEREMGRQVNPDGSSYETSTSYHRLVMEIFLWADAVCDAAGEPLSAAYKSSLHRMEDFVRAYTSPSGKAAQFGDNDSGRVVSCGVGDSGDHRYLLGDDADIGGAVDRRMLCGARARAVAAGPGDGSFPDGGYWFMRTEEAWLGVRGGIVSHKGAHAHCDQLSFVLSVRGCDFIIDPGTGVYSSDPAKRNHYRSTGAHNACRINAWETNTYSEGKPGLFRMADDTRTEVLDWQCNDEVRLFVGRHQGYERHRGGVSYQRQLSLRSSSLEIRDRLDGLESGDRLSWAFRFGPGVELRKEDGLVAAVAGSERIRISTPDEAEADIIDSRYSPSYGVEQGVSALLVSATPAGKAGTYTIKINWNRDTSAAG